MLNAEVTKILFENEELKAERDTLAGLVAKLRGAAQYALEECVDLIGTEEGKRLQTALSLPLPDAAANVAEWREKAELLDLLETKGWSLVHGIGVWNVMSRTGHSTVPVASGVTAIAALRAARGGR